jgi:hypothetical protein
MTQKPLATLAFGLDSTSGEVRGEPRKAAKKSEGQGWCMACGVGVSPLLL